MLLIKSLFLLAIILVLGFFRTPAKIWTAIIAIILILFSALSVFPLTLLVIFWTLFIITAAFFNFSSIRFATLMPWIIKRFRRLLPPISKSEQAVLDAGDVWWEGDLFCGTPDWQKLCDMPKPELSKEEQAFLDNQVETLCAMLDEWKMVYEDRQIPTEVWDYLKKEKFLGLVIEKKYGGLGFSHLAHSHIITKISSRSSSVAITVMVPNSLGTGEFIQQYGTEAQKEKYLPKLVTGEEIPAFALTSTTAGSDAGNLPDSGVICKDTYNGEEVLGIRLNWDKRYITLAPMATVLGLAFKLSDPQQLLGEQKNLGITLCVVPTDLPGVEIGKKHSPGGLAFLNGPTRGKDVFVPIDFVIGGADNCGKGWKILMEGLAGGRGVSLPALSTGGAKVAYRATGAYAALREQFRTPIGNFEGVMESLARIGGLTYICEATRYFNLIALEQGIKPSLGSAISKYHITEMARKIVNDAMDVHGGRTVQFGPRNYLGSIYQTLPVAITVEGANILTRNMIIFGQGAMRCHPFVRDEIAAVTDADEQHGALRFDTLLCKHIGYGISNFIKTFIYGLSGGFFISTKANDELSKYYRQLTRMSVALSFVADVMSARFGGALKRKEQFSARVGDVLSQLYLASAVIKYYHDQGRPETDRPFVLWALENGLADIQTAFDGLCHNLTPRWLGRIMYRMIFPWGISYHPPKDELGHEIALSMLKNSQQRDRMTEFCYIGKNQTDPLGRLEHALQASEEIGPLRDKLQQVVEKLGIPRHTILSEQIQQVAKSGELSAEELKALTEFEKLYTDALKVDEFNI
jgi:acyl-CoA dehydrogenase